MLNQDACMVSLTKRKDHWRCYGINTTKKYISQYLTWWIYSPPPLPSQIHTVFLSICSLLFSVFVSIRWMLTWTWWMYSLLSKTYVVDFFILKFTAGLRPSCRLLVRDPFSDCTHTRWQTITICQPLIDALNRALVYNFTSIGVWWYILRYD